MSNFAALIATIQANIKTNGNEEITGDVLQDVLEAMVDALGTEAINDLETALSNEVGNRQNADGTLQNNIDAEALRAGTAEGALQTAINGIKSNIDNGFVYAGIATPSGTPASGKVFYLAVTAGTYTNFGGLVVTQGINILKNNGTAWSQEQLIALDNTPTPSSSGLVKSGGVFEEIMTNGSAFDLTVHNSGTTYADLSAALTAMDSLPAAYKKGGMSIKFVQTSDNKYVQFMLLTENWTTNVNEWRGVINNNIFLKSDDDIFPVRELYLQNIGQYNALYIGFAVGSTSKTIVITTLPDFSDIISSVAIPSDSKVGDILELSNDKGCVVLGLPYSNISYKIPEAINIEQATDLSNSPTIIASQYSGYDYIGIATPSVNPGSPKKKVFYIAKQAGIYTSFGGLEVVQGLTILKFNGTTWIQENLIGIDNKPTFKSDSLLKSGIVFTELLPNYAEKDGFCIKELYLDGLENGTQYYLSIIQGSSNKWLQIYDVEIQTAEHVKVKVNVDVDGDYVEIPLQNGISGYVLLSKPLSLINFLPLDSSSVGDLKYSPIINEARKGKYLSIMSETARYFDELWLSNLDVSQDYYIKFTYVSAASRYFQIYTTPVISGDYIVAQGAILDGKDYVFLAPNNSNIKGIVKLSKDTDYSDQGFALIRNGVVSDVSNSPSISKMLKNLVVGTSSNAHTSSLVAAVTCANEALDSRIFVEAVEIDLILQFHQYFSWTFFSGYTQDNPNKGLYLKNRIKLYFSQNSKVIFNYTGSNEWVMKLFSPFNSEKYGFELHGLNLEAKNCRYAIHDERASQYDVYYNVYKNCQLKLDNSENTYWLPKQCIGGGLGRTGTIVIDGCYFESVGISGTFNPIVTYHNAVAADAKSMIEVTNNYFAGTGTFRLSWYGDAPETLKTRAVVTNNNLGSQLVHEAEVPQSYNNHNTELLEWNNIIRS